MRPPLGLVLWASLGFGTLSAAAEYSWQLPPGFAAPPVPADNPMSIAKVVLGRRLFYERRLSITGTYSCASCHDPARAFTDGRAHPVGATGQSLRRSAMSLANAAYAPSYTWSNPRIMTLEQQMRMPLLHRHPIEMGLQGREPVVSKALAADFSYQAAFRTAFPNDPNPVRLARIIQAIASFERTLISGRSAFDRYVFDDDREALSPDAQRGMALFYGPRAGCAECHAGLTFAGPINTAGTRRVPPSFADNGLSPLPRANKRFVDAGLMESTHRSADRGKFKVPTLRNVAVTAPYLHDGSIATLAQVLDGYGGRDPGAHRGRGIRNPALSAGERDALLAFLQSLTDTEFLSNPDIRAPDDSTEGLPRGVPDPRAFPEMRSVPTLPKRYLYTSEF